MSKWACRKVNQFGLTDRQVEAVQCLVALGSDKLVAQKLGVDRFSANRLMRDAMKAMGVRSRVHLALKWDRRMAELRAQVPVSVFDLARRDAA